MNNNHATRNPYKSISLRGGSTETITFCSKFNGKISPAGSLRNKEILYTQPHLHVYTQLHGGADSSRVPAANHIKESNVIFLLKITV